MQISQVADQVLTLLTDHYKSASFRLTKLLINSDQLTNRMDKSKKP